MENGTDALIRETKDNFSSKTDEAESFLSDGISKLRAKMTPDGKSYAPPTIPETPSKAINDMLKDKCGKNFPSAPKYYLAAFICLVFSAIVKVYNLIYKDTTKPSHTMWMAACGIVGLEHVLACWVIYYAVLACSFLLQHILFYGFLLFCLLGIGLVVAGMVFFDKPKPQSPGFESNSKEE